MPRSVIHMAVERLEPYAGKLARTVLRGGCLSNEVVLLDIYDLTSKVMVTFFSLFGELERDMVSLRTKEALSAKKAKGVKLGKPVGTIQKSKFDKDIEKIKELLQYGLSVRKIAKHMGYPNYISLNKYLNKRHIKESIKI